ncbi:hypothetical protein GMST_30960 [Geomonas silvestris]|uniref:histidine kinase n=1 Tax=Geomonas silvestris TaxID=2740184 RepID=A0A6V8ML56_9BACT|nr:MEDS domain-containing protein [Geomonas silvestris]GFO60771.1 hypothetical protein GMST_30960 [Geomonas silvestris]
MSDNNEPIEQLKLERDEGPGHLCLLYESEAELLVPVVPFIQKGVQLGQRCIYLNAGEEMLDCVLKNALASQKSDLGALMVLSSREVWLQLGSFDPQRVLGLLQSLCARALGDGFKGTRIICDMGWAGGGAVPGRVLAEFELELTRFAERNQVRLLCLYHRGSFRAEQLLELARLHRQLLIGEALCNNPFFVPGEDEAGITATSELDLFLAAVQASSGAANDRERLRQELEQAYAALARKIYENWQEEDTLRANEQELQEKDEAILEHRRRLQTVLQHLPVVLMALDHENRLASCNHLFEHLTGYRAEEVMGKQLLELLEVDEEEHQEVLLAHPGDGGDYRDEEWPLRCKDGSVKAILWSNLSWYVPIQGWPNWIIGIDITATRHAERGLYALGDELKVRGAELEALGHAVSHDLSGELARIEQQCTLLRQLGAASLASGGEEVLAEMHRTIRESAGRVQALKRFTALAAEGLSPEQVDLSAIAAEIAAKLGGRSGEHRVTFNIEQGVTATGDRQLLQLALEQLLENAWNSTCGVAHPLIRFGATEVEGKRSFFVSDNGPRRPSKLPSQKLHSRSGSGLGGGLGLVTVQRIISLHRGRIWAALEAERGATFYFRV